jgi:hypothetical protein
MNMILKFANGTPSKVLESGLRILENVLHISRSLINVLDWTVVEGGNCVQGHVATGTQIYNSTVIRFHCCNMSGNNVRNVREITRLFSVARDFEKPVVLFTFSERSHDIR